jgi:cation:H+ antiporter
VAQVPGGLPEWLVFGIRLPMPGEARAAARLIVKARNRRFIVAGVLLVVSFAVMVAGAVVFTNAVEWAGVRLDLGHGAVGSVLAAVATAMPESLIPIVAIIQGKQGGQIAVGAIVGAPFLLATLAMAVCGAAALVWRARRGSARLRLDRHATARDLLVVLLALPVAIAIGLLGAPPLRFVGAAVLVAGYGVFTWKTIIQARREGGGAEPASLYFDTTKHDPPNTFQIVAQTVASLGVLVGAAELFVGCVEHLARGLGADALILTLVIAPLATELPEKLNSVTWVRQGKDTLAVGNITGAMVFQSMPLVAFGMVFTDWRLTAPALLAMVAALGGAALSLIAVLRARRWSVPFIGCWAGLYAGTITSVIAVT